MGKREDEWRAGLEHAVHLSEDPADVAHVVERPRAEREVDRPRREEREIGEVSLSELELHLFGLGKTTRVRQLFPGVVDPDDLGTVSGEGDGALRASAAEVEDPFARDVPAQAQLVLVGDLGAVGRGLGRDARVGLVPGRQQVPGAGILGRHVAIFAPRAR